MKNKLYWLVVDFVWPNNSPGQVVASVLIHAIIILFLVASIVITIAK